MFPSPSRDTRSLRGIRRGGLLGFGLLLAMAFPAPLAFGGGEFPEVGLGYEVQLTETGATLLRPLPAAGLSPDHPLYLRVKVPWSIGPPESGNLLWNHLDRLVRRHVRSGYRVILSLLAPELDFIGTGPPSDPIREEVLESWLEFTRAVAGRYRKQVSFFGILDDSTGPGGKRLDAARFAFLLKKTAVAIKSENPGARILIGGGPRAQLARLAGLYREELSPYVDIWLLRPEAGRSIGEILEEAGNLALEVDPSCRLWLGGLSPGERGEDLFRSFLESAGRGAGLTLFRLPFDGEGLPVPADPLLRIHEHFGPGYVRMEDPPDAVTFRSESGSTAPVHWFRFFDAEHFSILLGYFSADPRVGKGTSEVILDSWDVTELALFDLAQGGRTFPGLYLPDRTTNTTSVNLPFGPGARLLTYRRFATPDVLRQEETLEVTGRRELSVEEIIARHQEVQSAQDAGLRSYVADGELTFHYGLGNSANIVDLTYRSTFLYDAEAGAEWVQKELLWNGVSYRGKKIPKLPYVEPERVVSLPLDIALTKDYAYRLVGSERVRGRDCYEVSFAPQREDKSLYKGKVWIDKKTFAKVKIASVQTHLEGATISNEQRDAYRPISTGDGDFWLLHRIDGQQMLTVSGRNLVILREIEFTNFRVNPSDFAQVRQAAYDSNDPILKDTPRGFRYLEKKKDGTRVLREDTGDRTLLGLAGVFFNESVDFPVPLAGLNYFDFHIGESQAQLELFTAGAFNLVNITHPHLFGGPLEVGVDFIGRAFQLTDRFFLGEDEIRAAHVDDITQILSLNVGYPFADFFKIRGVFEFAFTNFSRDEETGPDFVVPVDTAVNSVELRGEFHRAGWSAEAFARESSRNNWEIWGVDDTMVASPLEGSRFSDFNPEQEDYLQYGATVSKQFFLPFFQKIRLEANWFQGEDLDRFSKFRFASFGGTSLRGFGGSGIRFDKGGIGRVQYSFNIAEILRFDAFVDHARVRDRTLASGDDLRDFTGVGIAANFVLRGGLIVNLNYGIGILSDIDGLEGEQEAQLIFLKLF